MDREYITKVDIGECFVIQAKTQYVKVVSQTEDRIYCHTYSMGETEPFMTQSWYNFKGELYGCGSADNKENYNHFEYPFVKFYPNNLLTSLPDTAKVETQATDLWTL